MLEYIAPIIAALALLLSIITFLRNNVRETAQKIDDVKNALHHVESDVAVLKAQRQEDVRGMDKLDEKLDAILENMGN